MYLNDIIFYAKLKVFWLFTSKDKKHMHKYLQLVQTLCKFAVVSPV